MERGLKPHKYRVPFAPIIKWLVIGFLGTLIIIIMLGGFLAWRLNPSFSFDGQTGNIEMLNGAVKIHFNANNDEDISIKYLPQSNLSSPTIKHETSVVVPIEKDKITHN